MGREATTDADFEMLDAARSGDLARLRAAIGAGADPGLDPRRGVGPLGNAVLGRNADCLAILLGLGDDHPRSRRLRLARCVAEDLRLPEMSAVLAAHALAMKERRVLAKIRPATAPMSRSRL